MLPLDYKPETNEERAARLKEKQDKSIFKNVTFKEVISRVADVIIKTSQYTMMPINKDNPKSIGGILFWIESDSTGRVDLKYNIPPKKWDIDHFIFSLEREELNIINHQRNLLKSGS